MKKELSLTAIAVFAAALTMIGLANDAEAAAYIKFDGVDGEATDSKHKEWIDVLSFQQAITRADSSSSARARASAVFHDIVITKELDKSSPKIAEAIAMGMVYPSVEFEITDSSRAAYLKYELKNVMVTSYSISGSANDVPVEEISLNYEEIKVTYTENDSSGQSKGNVEYSWKVEEGTS
jgi:type VI secretion system secreted protein Hcp